MTVDCMREQLLEGKKIRLGDLGDFSIVLSSKGAEDADKFTVQNITDVKVLWEPGSEFKNLLAEAIRATQDRNLEDHSSNRHQRSYGACHLAWNFELYGIA